MYDTTGKHLILDLWEVERGTDIGEFYLFDVLKELQKLILLLENTVVTSKVHKFPNGAYSLVLVLAESHLSIHTWKEEKFISLDFYSCNFSTDMDFACEKLIEIFRSKKYNKQIIIRGIENGTTTRAETNSTNN